MANHDDEEKVYKKFLLQKGLLDMLRVYLDLNDSFLDKLLSTNVLTTEEHKMIKMLPWPSNRNELLQTLIKKKWTKDKFNSFHEIMKETQNDQLMSFIATKTETMKHEQEEDLVNKIDDPYKDMLAEKLADLPLATKNMIKGMLHERDTEIKSLKGELSETKNSNLKFQEEAHQNKVRYEVLEKAVQEMLAVMQFDHEHESQEESLAVIKRNTVSLNKQVNDLLQEKQENTAMIEKLRETISSLTSEIFKLNETLTALQATLDEKTRMYEEKISSLETTLSNLKKKMESDASHARRLEQRLKQSIVTMEYDLGEANTRIQTLSKELKETTEECERLQYELEEVQDRTRKLLGQLNMDKNAPSNLALSIDHARNMTIMNKRKTSIQASKNRSGLLAWGNNAETVTMTALPGKVIGLDGASSSLSTARRDSTPKLPSVGENSSPKSYSTVSEEQKVTLENYRKTNDPTQDVSSADQTPVENGTSGKSEDLNDKSMSCENGNSL